MTPRAASASRQLWLSPDWNRPETWLGSLSAYLHGADPEGDACLRLDASRPGAPVAFVAALVGQACERLAGEEPFADVLVADEPVDPLSLVPVHSAEEVDAALGGPRPALPQEPERLLERARWAKEVADGLRAVADRWHFERAPAPWSARRPLVTVRIPTWHGVEGLMRRAIPSVLGGDYDHLELLVCSDGPDPEARAAVESHPDPRVRYLELPERPRLPTHPWSFWQVTGLRPANHALDQARGAFICPLDHDDAFTKGHIAQMLDDARLHRADLVHGQALCEQADGPPFVSGSAPLRLYHVAHGGVMYSSRLAHMRYDTECWLLDEPGDWNMWRRMQGAGARVSFLREVILAHSREQTSIEGDPRADPSSRGAAELVVDVLATDARWLLDVAPLPGCAPTS